MNAFQLDHLADLFSVDQLPAWVLEVVEKDRERIERELREHGQTALTGPHGEQLTIRLQDTTARVA